MVFRRRKGLARAGLLDRERSGSGEIPDPGAALAARRGERMKMLCVIGVECDNYVVPAGPPAKKSATQSPYVGLLRTVNRLST